MDYAANVPLDGTTISQELNQTRILIGEIKAHTMESKLSEGVDKNPRAEHKLSNLKADIRDINKSLEEVLQSVVLL